MPPDTNFRGGETMEQTDGQPKRKSIWKQFCSSTAMHGLQYLAKEGSSKFERAFWAVALLLCLAGCVALVLRVYTRWASTPAMSTSELKVQAVWELPFPAVTICPEVKIKRSSGNASEDLEGLEENYNTVKQLLCDVTPSTGAKKTISDDELDFLSVSPNYTDIVKGYRWKNFLYANLGLAVNGYENWIPVLTEEGLCFALNMMRNEEVFTEIAVQRGPPDSVERPWTNGSWSPGQGYSPSVPVDAAYPARAQRGMMGGTSILLCATVSDMDYTCRGPMQGFKVALHSPAETPRMQHFTRSLLAEELLVHVMPSTMSTSDDLRGYDPKDRQCFFPEERQLRYFQVYTKNNCELECASNASWNSCGCVAFYMPRSADIPICGPGSIECLHSAEGKVEDMQEGGLCNCLPSCSSLGYDMEATRATFDWEKSVQAWRYTDNDFDGKDCARVAVFFKDTAVVASTQRSALYSSEKFIAACAGVLGLFTGFSLINVIEAFYFLVLGFEGRFCFGSWRFFPRSLVSPSENTGENKP